MLLTISGWPGLLDPICKVPYKVEEKITFRNTDYFVSNFHKQTKSLTGSQIQSLSNILTKIFGSC